MTRSRPGAGAGSGFSDAQQAELATALGFTPDDLDANRAGILTGAQIAHLRQDLRHAYWPLMLGLSGAAFGLAGLGFALDVVIGLIMLVPVTAQLAAAMWLAVMLRQQLERVPDSTVQTGIMCLDERTLRLLRRGSSEARFDYPLADGAHAAAPRQLARALQVDQPYRVFYVEPASRWFGSASVLSLEPVAPPDEA